MKLALVLDYNPQQSSVIAERMTARQRSSEAESPVRVDFARGTLLALSRADEPASSLLIRRGDGGSFVVIAGVPLALTDGGERAAACLEQAIQRFLSGTHAEHLVRQLDGVFAAICWDAGRNELTIGTDALGLQPLYSFESREGTLYASSLRALAASGELPVVPDAVGWGAVLLSGQPLGNRSALSGAWRVAAGSLISHAPGQRQERQWWSWPTAGTRRHSESAVKEIGEVVREIIRGLDALAPNAAQLCSGGFDSRLILSVLLARGRRPRLLVQQHPDEAGDADAAFARAFAHEHGLTVSEWEADPHFFGSEDYLTYLERTEVLVPSMELFVAQVIRLVLNERQGVWEGLMMGTAFKFDRADRDLARFRSSVRRARGDHRAVLRRVFSPEWASAMEVGFDEALDGHLAQFPDDPEGVLRAKLAGRLRYRTGGNPYQVYDPATLPLTPGASRALWEAIATLDPSARATGRLYTDLFAHLAPHGLSVPIVSGGVMYRGSRGGGLYLKHRTVDALQRQIRRRPRLGRVLRALGIATGFRWARSPLHACALRDAELVAPYVNADWLERRRRGLAVTPDDDLAETLLLYFVAWHRLLDGSLRTAWSLRPA